MLQSSIYKVSTMLFFGVVVLLKSEKVIALSIVRGGMGFK
jgi:hypothetical protein